MTKFLARFFIKNRSEYENPDVRHAYGVLCSTVGIALNLLLFVGKFAAGILSASIAITADAFNNLSDAGSSVITLAGFRLAKQKPDPQHPFGHGRFEYLSALFVSLLILLMGFELGKSSLEKIFNPTPVEFRWVTVIILSVSVAVKLYMALYNRAIGRKIRSEALLAVVTDSLGDAVATSVVLCAVLLAPMTDLNLDGYCGAAVAVMILIAGFRSAKQTISPLLGQPPEPEFVQSVEKTVLSHPQISGIHDLIVNDYGPGRKIISLHAEVPADANVWDAHDMIDNVERELATKLGCIAVIHMDPVVTEDEAAVALREAIRNEVREVHPGITIHDFRMVPGPTHTNVIFDAVLPYESSLSEEEARERIVQTVSKYHENTNVIVEIDRSYA